MLVFDLKYFAILISQQQYYFVTLIVSSFFNYMLLFRICKNFHIYWL